MVRVFKTVHIFSKKAHQTFYWHEHKVKDGWSQLLTRCWVLLTGCCYMLTGAMVLHHLPSSKPTHPYSSTSLDVSADLGPASAARPVKPAEDASCHSLKPFSFTESSLLFLIPIPTVKVHHRVLLLTWVWSLQQDLRHGKTGGGRATETGHWWLSRSGWVCLVLALHTRC